MSDPVLADYQRAFRDLAARQAAGVLITIPANNPPLTGREVLQLLFGEPHGSHSVALWSLRTILRDDDRRENVIALICSCGHVFRVDNESCTERTTYVHVVEEALEHCPTLETWGDD